jgi:hypothetical protein
MAGVAAAGLVLLDAGRAGRLDTLTAAVVALAVGGSAEVSAVPDAGLPFGLRGGVNVMPLGVSLTGAVLLGVLLLRRGRDGLLVRGAGAAIAILTGLAMVTRLARGTVRFQLPDLASASGGGLGAASSCSKGRLPAATGLAFGKLGGGLQPETIDAQFSLALGTVLTAALAWTLVVVGVCWLAARLRIVSVGLRALLWPLGAITIGCLLAAWALHGSAAAGGVLLVLPTAVLGMLLLGLGIPWTVRSDGPLSCALDGAGALTPDGALVWVSGTALLGYAMVIAARTSARSADRSFGGDGGMLRRAAALAGRLAPAVGALLATMALLARASVTLGATAFGFSLPVLDANLAANPLLSLWTGLVAGAAAGFVASLLVDGLGTRISVSLRAWNDRVRR